MAMSITTLTLVSICCSHYSMQDSCSLLTHFKMAVNITGLGAVWWTILSSPIGATSMLTVRGREQGSCGQQAGAAPAAHTALHCCEWLLQLIMSVRSLSHACVAKYRLDCFWWQLCRLLINNESEWNHSLEFDGRDSNYQVRRLIN